MGERLEKIVFRTRMDNQNIPSQQRFWSLLTKKLANQATDIELDELQSILVSNSNLHHQADLITAMWEQGSSAGNFANEAAYMRHVMKYKDDFFTDESNEAAATGFIDGELEEEKRPGFRSMFSKRLTIISFVTLIIAATGAIYFLSGKKIAVAAAKQEISSVVTKNGNRTNIVLPDGSKVWLNAGSNLDYNNSTFNKGLREVTLNGEAYFDVVKNAEKPFIIHTKKMDIKVVGTIFNVRSYNDEKTAEASLIHGTIEVTLKGRNDQKIVLEPNEKICISTEEEKQQDLKTDEKAPLKRSSTSPIAPMVIDKLKPNPTNNIIPEIAWTQNKLYLDDETLEDIGYRIEKWFGKKITIANESLKTVRYTANFENETMEEVLSYLKLSKPFNFRIGNDNVVIY